jgi:hypothetical protein
MHLALCGGLHALSGGLRALRLQLLRSFLAGRLRLHGGDSRLQLLLLQLLLAQPVVALGAPQALHAALRLLAQLPHVQRALRLAAADVAQLQLHLAAKGRHAAGDSDTTLLLQAYGQVSFSLLPGAYPSSMQ